MKGAALAEICDDNQLLDEAARIRRWMQVGKVWPAIAVEGRS